jgi:hypothetical protein
LSAHRAVVTQREMKRIMNNDKISGYWDGKINKRNPEKEELKMVMKIRTSRHLEKQKA